MRLADRIITLEQGRIIEDGTHDELIRKRGALCRIASPAGEHVGVCHGRGIREMKSVHSGRAVPRAPAARRRDLELAFLPAALEIVETPPSPIGRAIALVIIAAFLRERSPGLCGEHVDVIATAQGKIMPSGRSKVVQPFDTGVIRAIHVRDGQSRARPAIC